MAARGKVGKHPDGRMGHRTKAELEHDVLEPGEITITPADPKWHQAAIRMYESFRGAPQEPWFAQSDWDLLWIKCENISRELKPQFVGMKDQWNASAQTMEHLPVRETVPIKGAAMMAIMKGFGDHLASIADRRRLQFEMGRPKSGEQAGQTSTASVSLLQGGLTG